MAVPPVPEAVGKQADAGEVQPEVALVEAVNTATNRTASQRESCAAGAAGDAASSSLIFS